MPSHLTLPLPPPSRDPSGMQDDPGSSRGEHTQLLWEDTRLCHRAPALAGGPPGLSESLLGPWPELLPSPGRLVLCGNHIIHGWGDGKLYQTHTHSPTRS